MYKTNQKQIKGIDWEKKKLKIYIHYAVKYVYYIEYKFKKKILKWYHYKISEQDI